MTNLELERAIDGLFAYDTGCTNGIKDEWLREKVVDHLNSLPDKEMMLVLSRFVREHYLSEEALVRGYGIEDVNSFIKWLSSYMKIDL